MGNTTVADAFAGAGTMTYLGSVGNFDVNVTNRVSKPALGGDVMEFNTVNVSSGAAGTLTIGLTVTGFSGNYLQYAVNYGGTTTGPQVNFGFQHHSLNREFGFTSFLNRPNIVGPSFSDSGAFQINPGTPYFLTIVADISHDPGSQNTSFDAELRPVPVPTTVWLFGSGILGLVAVARKKSA